LCCSAWWRPAERSPSGPPGPTWSTGTQRSAGWRWRPSAIEAASARLEHSDKNVRRAAVNALVGAAGTGSALAVASASARLEHADPEVRWAAVDALGKLPQQAGDERTIAALSARLKDEDGAVRQAAVEALVAVAGMVDERAVAAVRGAFFEDPDGRVRAATLGLLQVQTRALARGGHARSR